MDAGREKWRWPRFSLRTLFIFITITGIICGWLGLKSKHGFAQRYAVNQIKKLGGGVSYKQTVINDPFGVAEPTPWYRELLGDDFFDTVTSVDLAGTRVTDKELTIFKYLPDVEYVSFRLTSVGASGLTHLKHLAKLEQLDLFGTQLDDAGLAELRSFPALKRIMAGKTKVTDAGLVHVGQMTQLTYFGVMADDVTDAGVTQLQGLVNLDGLFLSQTRVTDAGLVYLRKMTKLNCLYLDNLNISDAGMKNLEPLAVELRYLTVHDTPVTSEAIERLQRVLPNCSVEWGPSSNPQSSIGGDPFR